MPWPHCGNTISDDQSCPACGLSKQEWSIKFNVTRPFQIAARPLVKLELRDEGGGYVADEPCLLKLPDGTEQSVRLNKAGYAKGTSKVPGMVEVIFPERAGQVSCAHPDVERAGDSFFCPTSREKYEFRMADPLVALQVEALRGAARRATPFCEKCERARQQERADGEAA